MCTLRKIIGDHQGLTLMELMIVIAILAIMAGMSMSALGNYIPDYRLQSAARELYANMHKAKMEAIKRNQDVDVDFEVSNSRYVVSFEDKDGNDVNINVVNFSKYDNDVSYGIGNADYKGSSENVVSYDNNFFSFKASGRCTKSGYVYLTNSKGNAFAIGTLQSGIIAVLKWNGTNWDT